MLLEFYKVKSQKFVRVFLREIPFILEVKRVNTRSRRILYEFLIELMSRKAQQ